MHRYTRIGLLIIAYGRATARTTKAWVDRDAYLIGAEILDRTDIRARRLLCYTRLPFLMFPLMIVFLLWHFAGALPMRTRATPSSFTT